MGHKYEVGDMIYFIDNYQVNSGYVLSRWEYDDDSVWVSHVKGVWGRIRIDESWDNASKNRIDVEKVLEHEIAKVYRSLLKSNFWIKDLFRNWLPHNEYERKAMLRIISEKLNIDLSEVNNVGNDEYDDPMSK